MGTQVLCCSPDATGEVMPGILGGSFCGFCFQGYLSSSLTNNPSGYFRMKLDFHWWIWRCTLPETKSSHLKIGRNWKGNVLVFQPSIFRCELAVSFREAFFRRTNLDQRGFLKSFFSQRILWGTKLNSEVLDCNPRPGKVNVVIISLVFHLMLRIPYAQLKYCWWKKSC